MVFQPSHDATHDHDAEAEQLVARQQCRLERVFRRRAQKAVTYHRIPVVTIASGAALSPTPA